MRRAIGKTGISVNAIGLGGMPLSLKGRPDEADAIKVVHAAVEQGVDFIDTANVYCIDDEDIGHNERLIAKALRSANAFERVKIATKGGLARPGGEWTVHGKPGALRRACEASLVALGVERIFLYQLHAVDADVPFADSVGELQKLQQEGKIEHVGLSNVSLDQLNEAQAIVRIESVQNRCNPVCKRDFASGLIQACENQEVTYLPYSPVGGHFGHVQLKDHPVLVALGEAHNTSSYNICLAWLLHKSSAILPIPGASKVKSIVSSCAAPAILLKESEIAEIDGLSDQ